jgi:DNA-binding transcriptional LysR family regulator
MPRFDGEWLLGVNTIAEIKETLIRKGGMSFLPWPAVEQEHKKGTLTAFRLYPPMRPRTIKIISRLHNARPAVRDFCEAAESLSGIKEFPG